jgi:hypothetical protein
MRRPDNPLDDPDGAKRLVLLLQDVLAQDGYGEMRTGRTGHGGTLRRKVTDEQPKQQTPKGVEIPVPTRDEFLRDLRKVAPPARPDDGQGKPHSSG